MELLEAGRLILLKSIDIPSEASWDDAATLGWLDSSFAQLIADALATRGVEVVHLLGPGQRQPHVLNPAAVIGSGGVISYPAT